MESTFDINALVAEVTGGADTTASVQVQSGSVSEGKGKSGLAA